MKNEKQIKGYVYRQSWFRVFVENARRYSKTHHIARYHFQEFGISAIGCAFRWSDTKQGKAYWQRVNDSYQAWFLDL